MSSLYLQPVAFCVSLGENRPVCTKNPYRSGSDKSSLLKTAQRVPHKHHYKTGSAHAIEAEERTPSLLIVRRAEQRLALAQQLLRRRAPRVVFRKRNRVDRHAPTCAVQADLDP